MTPLEIALFASVIITALGLIYGIYRSRQNRAIKREKLAQENRKVALQEREQIRLDAKQKRQEAIQKRMADERHRNEGLGFSSSHLRIAYEHGNFGLVPEGTPKGTNIYLYLTTPTKNEFKNVKCVFPDGYERIKESGDLLVPGENFIIKYKYNPDESRNPKSFTIFFENVRTGFKATHIYNIIHGLAFIELIKVETL